jgi:uncharacterized protein
MLDLLKEIMFDSQDKKRSIGIARHLKYERVPGKAFVCIGVRRCGRSTLLMQIIDSLARQNVRTDNILFIKSLLSNVKGT